MQNFVKNLANHYGPLPVSGAGNTSIHSSRSLAAYNVFVGTLNLRVLNVEE